MHHDYRRLMAEATRLTRAGNLSSATALLKEVLRDASATADPGDAWRASPVSRDAQPSPPSSHDTIVVEPRTIDAFVQARPTPRPSSKSGRFIAGSFSNPAGSRQYKLYVPPMAGDRPLPLVVMLHGCTQDADDFARGTAMNEAARAQGFFVLYPEQSREMNPQRCWNWFKHTHQQRGRGEPSLLADMTRDVMSRYAIDRSRVYVAGLSAGGAMAAILGTTYPDVFGAVGVHSGLAAAAASDLPSALAAMRSGSTSRPDSGSGMPTIVFHGDADHTVHPKNAEQVIAASIGSEAVLTPEEATNHGSRNTRRRVHRDAAGRVIAEIWNVQGASHAWSGGSSDGSFTDPSGPDATGEMLRFFFDHQVAMPS